MSRRRSRPAAALLALTLLLAHSAQGQAADPSGAPPLALPDTASLASGAPVADGWPAWVPGTAATAAVYGSLYLTVLAMVSVVGTTVALTAPPTMVWPLMTFGLPAATVAVMRQMVPLVVERVPPTVLGWFGIAPPPPPQPAAVAPPG